MSKYLTDNKSICSRNGTEGQDYIGKMVERILNVTYISNEEYKKHADLYQDNVLIRQFEYSNDLTEITGNNGKCDFVLKKKEIGLDCVIEVRKASGSIGSHRYSLTDLLTNVARKDLYPLQVFFILYGDTMYKNYAAIEKLKENIITETYLVYKNTIKKDMKVFDDIQFEQFLREKSIGKNYELEYNLRPIYELDWNGM